MHRLIISLLLVIFSQGLLAQNWDWAKKTGKNYNGNDAGRVIELDKNGNLCMAGLVKGYNSFGDTGNYTPTDFGGHDIYMEKTDNEGNMLWVKRFGSSGTDQALGLDIDVNNNWYVGGYYSDQCNFGDSIMDSQGSFDCFVLSLDSLGEHRWVFSFGGSGRDDLNSLSCDDFGNSYVSGGFSDTLYFGDDFIVSNGDVDIFIAKIDPNGNPLWIKGFGGPFKDLSRDIEVRDANIYFVGNFKDKVIFDSDTVFVYGGAKWDAFICRADTAGNILWAESDGGLWDDVGVRVDIDNNGNIIFGGNYTNSGYFGAMDEEFLTSNGLTDIFISFYDTTGTLTKVISFGGIEGDGIHSLNYAQEINKILLGVRFQDTIQFQGVSFESEGPTDLCVMQFNDTLGLEWKKQIKGVPYGSKPPNIGSIYADSLSNVFVNGAFLTPVYFDTTLLTPHPVNADMFFGKIRPKLKALFSVENEICQYDSLEYFNKSTYNASNFEWHFEGGQPAISLAENPTVHYDSVGQYNVTLFISGDNQVDTLFYADLITVKGLPNVNIGADTALCDGQQLQLDAGDYEIYQWNTGSTDPQIVVDSSGLYFALVTDTLSCSNTDSILVQFNGLPIVDLGTDTTICQGDSILLSAGNGFVFYEWNTGSTESEIYVDSSGLYIVELSNEHFCFNLDSVFVSVEVCVNIKEEILAQNIKLYPNPTSGSVTIESANFALQIKKVFVFSNSGQQIHFENIASESKFEIDLHGLSKGVYIVQMHFIEGDVIYKKLFITD